MPERGPGKPCRSTQRPAPSPARTRKEATAVRADQADSENPSWLPHWRHEKPCSLFSTREPGSAAFKSFRHADKNSIGTSTCAAFTMPCHAFSRSKARLHSALRQVLLEGFFVGEIQFAVKIKREIHLDLRASHTNSPRAVRIFLGRPKQAVLRSLFTDTQRFTNRTQPHALEVAHLEYQSLSRREATQNFLHAGVHLCAH